MDPTHPYAPWCIPESCHVRACVRDLGGRGSDGPCMAGKLSKGIWIACDDGRWRRRADLRRELRCLICLRRPNLRKPPHAAAHSGAVRTRRTDDSRCRVLQRALR